MPVSRKLLGYQTRRDVILIHEPEGSPSGRSGGGSLFTVRTHGASTAHSRLRQRRVAGEAGGGTR